MEVHDEHIPAELFATFTEMMPECTVEIVVEFDDGVLLAKRENEPAKGDWFWPGSRLYKGEELTQAVDRISSEELDLDVELVEMLGVYSHFWETSELPGNPTRHTVNTVFHVRPTESTASISLDEQHSDFRIVDEIEPGLHEYVRQYLQDSGILA